MTKTPNSPQTGAGIATLIDVPGVPPGNVDLFAPHGTVDAGEGGIRVSGNFTVAALQVLNIANIQVQGTSSGIPTVVGPPVVALTQASTANTATQQAGLPAQSGNNDRPSVIIVEVLGYGGGADEDGPSQENEQRRKNDGRQGYDQNSAVQVVGYGGLTGREARSLTDEEKQKLGH